MVCEMECTGIWGLQWLKWVQWFGRKGGAVVWLVGVVVCTEIWMTAALVEGEWWGKWVMV